MVRETEKKRAGRDAARMRFETSERAQPVGPPSVQAYKEMRVRSSTASLSSAFGPLQIVVVDAIALPVARSVAGGTV